ncbi:MAG: choice-of-anchor Q domain-containing protein, partial [Chloroflexota bacterium]|nr:choice-of-anchor Q domain-containing protein [Chloroflexota bacterium]
LFTNGAMTVANTIVWGNTTDIAMLGGPGTLVVSYSDIEDGWTGTGNLNADPRFVDAANGDYHLDVGSSCIDKGTPVGAPTHDIEGTPRDSAPDMGAYEWTGFRIFLPLVLRNVGP